MMFFVVALLLAPLLGIAGATEWKWRLINMSIILVFTGLGFAIGYMAFGGQVAIPLGVSIGAAGAAGSSVWNKWRKKADHA